MINKILIEKFISAEIEGKNAAIHAYDKMMWMVRSGYLTLVFAGWGFVIKAALENSLDIQFIKPYILLLSSFSIVLAFGAFLIDRNYARRKFRVITAVNELIQLVLTHDINKADLNVQTKLTLLLSISGDADNTTYQTPAFRNEMFVSNLIYLIPSILISIISLGYTIKY